MEESLEVLSWGSRYVLSSYGPGLRIVCFFIHLYGSLCVEDVCDPVGPGYCLWGIEREKCVRILLGDDSGLNISNDKDLIMATTGRNM
jgi:hypothetical protein